MSRTIRQRRLRERRNSRRRAQVLVVLSLLGVASLAGAAYGAYDYLKGDDASWPSIDKLQPQRIGENSIVLDRNGKLLGYIKSDQNRQNITYDSMGTWAPKATVAIEDRRFYQHHGVDPEGIMRALTINVQEGGNQQGASTITQQVIRNLYKEIGFQKNVRRKAKEATLALQLEQRWDKKKILETYLNLVFYGNNAYGIQAASRTYFNKSASQLTIPEAAMLAGLPQSPSRFDPFHVPAKAKARRDDVLRAMLAQGMIVQAEYDAAIATPITLSPNKTYQIHRQPYFFDYVQQELIGKFGSPTVRQGGLKIKTTIDPKMQQLAEDAIKRTLPNASDPSAAIAVLDTRTGEIRAMASSESYAKSKFNRAAQSLRQPGSTAKVWVLAAFVKAGINPDETTYISRAIRVKYKGAPDSAAWEPKTFEGTYSGSESIRRATLASDNSVFAQMTLDISPEKVAAAAHEIGIQSKLENVWSIGLGSQVVTPLEQTNFYSSIARGGIRIDPRSVSQVQTAGGTALDPQYPKSHRVLQDWQADEIRSILHDNMLMGTGINAHISGADDAGKTGTTDDSKDAWFCGMNPELTACVWVGHNIPTPMPGVQGAGFPSSIWHRFMEPAMDLVPKRQWFIVKGSPAWKPYTPNTWMDNPSLETSAASSYKPTTSAKADDAKDGDTDATAGAKEPATATPPTATTPPATTAPPATGTGAAPTTATPAPTG